MVCYIVTCKRVNNFLSPSYRVNVVVIDGRNGPAARTLLLPVVGVCTEGDHARQQEREEQQHDHQHHSAFIRIHPHKLKRKNI